MVPQGYHPANVFLVDRQLDRRVSAGQSGVSGVDWDITVFSNCGTTPGVPLELKLRPPALEVRRERLDSFPDEAGKWTVLLG